MYIIYKIGLAKLDKSLNEVLSVQQQHSETTIKLVVYDNGGTVLAKKKVYSSSFYGRSILPVNDDIIHPQNNRFQSAVLYSSSVWTRYA